jgi:hypothetical protein
MKAPKILAAGILAATALLSTASAQTKIYITGSTAFRAAAVTGIGGANGNTPGGTGALAGSFTVASNNSDITSADLVTYTGGNIGGTAVTIKLSWSGSGGGYQTVAGSLPVKFLIDGATGTANADIRVNGVNGSTCETATPDIGFGDTQQAATPFKGGSYVTLTTTSVGIVAFIFGATNGFPTGLSMTKKAFEYNYSGLGCVPLSTYNGDATDALAGRSFVYAFGRDPDSGTRTTALAEVGYGVNTAVHQNKPTISGNNISGIADYPPTTVNGILYAGPNMGESSGSTLRGYLNKVFTTFPNGESGPSYGVTYLGISDFLKVYTGTIGELTGSYAGGFPATPLAWNGVPFSQAGIKNGSYTFWSTELTTRRADLGNGTTGGPAVKLTFYTNMSNAIKALATSALSGNIKLSEMQVQRNGDGGPITSLNF